MRHDSSAWRTRVQMNAIVGGGELTFENIAHIGHMKPSEKRTQSKSIATYRPRPT